MMAANHLSQDDLLLFALQFLPEDEMARAQAHLHDCEDCRRQVAFHQGDLASYALTAEMEALPEGSKERLMRRVTKEKRPFVISTAATTPVSVVASPAVTPTDDELPTRRAQVFSFEDAPVKRRMGVVGWVGWAIAAAAIAAAGLQYERSQSTQNELAELSSRYTETQNSAERARTIMQALTDASAQQVVLHLPAGAKQAALPEGHASYLPQKGSLVFVADHLDPLHANRTYELWVLPAAKGAAPIPAGTFKPDTRGRASLVISNLPQGVAASGFGVTVEPDGGSATPTMPIVLLGE